jgi:plasmid maintenance system antidote protein VapI
MSKTVSELAQELGVSKQYLNRILTKHKLGKIKGNKKVVSDSDVKSILSMLERNIGNQKSETKNLVSDIPSKSTGSRDKGENGNQKSETKTETSFRYLREQLEIKGKEVERLHQLLDQSQQLLLNEQKKNQLLLETKIDEPEKWKEEKRRLENSVSQYRNSYNQASQRASENYNSAIFATKLFWIVTVIAVVLLVLLLVLAWVHFFRA